MHIRAEPFCKLSHLSWGWQWMQDGAAKMRAETQSLWARHTQVRQSWFWSDQWEWVRTSHSWETWLNSSPGRHGWALVDCTHPIWREDRKSWQGLLIILWMLHRAIKMLNTCRAVFNMMNHRHAQSYSLLLVTGTCSLQTTVWWYFFSSCMLWFLNV